MERKTMTTLGELREGDRFTYSAKRFDVWQVMKNEGKRVEVNQVDPETKASRHRFNDLKAGNTNVMFVRHSKPLPQEVCFIEDLEPGDVFCKQEDIVTEYVMMNRLKATPQLFKIRRLYDLQAAFPEYAGKVAQVIFIRKAEEASK